jgi:hypothetical protein
VSQELGQVVTSILAGAAIVLSIFTLWWSRKAEREQRRRDLILESSARMIANSKKLTHEHRKAFEQMANSVSNGPLTDVAMRHQSDIYRNEVGIERVVLQAFGNRAVFDAAEHLYQAHRRVRHAIWHGEDEDDRGKAWKDVSDWGVGPPSALIYPKFRSLLDALIEAVRRDAKIEAP